MMIDLRSDTLTVPTEGMRTAIANARVGDDVFGEDPTVNELQEYATNLLGKEAGLFVPSGVMGNQICLAVLTKPGDEIILEADAHIFYYETAGPAIISRVQTRCIKSEKGIMNEEEIQASIRPADYYFPRTSLICIENTHNRHGGSIMPLDYIRRVGKIARQNACSYHCDGARIWNAAAGAGITPKEYAEPFDTLSVCLSKGLGAPVGSVIVGKKEHIESARKWRKILGGGMRQAGILAAAGLYALKNHLSLLPGTHENARKFAKILSESEYLKINPETVETNIVVFGHSSRINPAQLEEECKKSGVLIIPIGNNKVRAVFHFQISTEEGIKAANIIKDVSEKLESSGNN